MNAKTSLRARLFIVAMFVLFLIISVNDGWRSDHVVTGYDGITFNTIEIDEIDCGE